MRTGNRVRVIGSKQTGTVTRIVRGNASNEVLVEWDYAQLDSRWNWHKSSWEPAHHLTAD